MVLRTMFRQNLQIRKSGAYNDSVAITATDLQTNAVTLEDDLNALRSVVSMLNDNQAGAWTDALTAPTGFENGAVRGVQDVSQDLHNLERKRALVPVFELEDVVVGASDNFVILGTGNLPANTTIAVGAVSTRGSVAADLSVSFGAHSLVEVAGTTTISPKNLCTVVDGATHDPILSGGRVVYALLQSENATDGFTATNTTPNRLQLSFVRINAAGSDLEACPAVDIQGRTIHYIYNERKAFADMNEQDFLRQGVVVDVPAGSTVTQQVAYDNQAGTVVTLGAYSPVIELADNQNWAIRRGAGQTLFSVQRQAAGPAHNVSIGAGATAFSSSAGSNDFDEGISAGATSPAPISIGASGFVDSVDGVIQSHGATADLTLRAGRELFLDDLNQTGSTWAQTGGIKLSDTTAEWDGFETQFGEVSLLKAITMAAQQTGMLKTEHFVAGTITADTDVGASPSTVDVVFPDLVTDMTQSNDVHVYLNGQLLMWGADAAANNDYYAGSANNLLRFEAGLIAGDRITIVRFGSAA